MNKFLEIFGINLLLTNKNYLLTEFSDKIKSGEKLSIIACDYRDLLYFKERENLLINTNTLFYPDSSGVFLLLRLLYKKKTKGFMKLVSTDFHYELLEHCYLNNYKIFLYGDTDETLDKFEESLNKKNKGIILGKLNGFSQLSNDEIVNQINNSCADVLLVGLGIPRQFEFLYKNQNKLDIPLSITVGAFFTFYSGTIKRAPKIIRNLSLEWLYRFIKEPKRLFKRYFVQFPYFVYRMILERFKTV